MGNGIQRISPIGLLLLWLVGGAGILLCLDPPWEAQWKSSEKYHVASVHAPVWSDPEDVVRWSMSLTTQPMAGVTGTFERSAIFISYSRISLECGALAILAVLIFISFRK